MSDSLESHYRLGVIPEKPKTLTFLKFIEELWGVKIADKSRKLPDFAQNTIFKWR